MQNDSIETLLLRHYGSAAPVPVDLERRLNAMVLTETVAVKARPQTASSWSQRRVSRRQIFRLATFTSAGLSVLAIGANTLEATLSTRTARRETYSL
jgi:hypothetical protein